MLRVLCLSDSQTDLIRGVLHDLRIDCSRDVLGRQQQMNSKRTSLTGDADEFLGFFRVALFEFREFIEDDEQTRQRLAYLELSVFINMRTAEMVNRTCPLQHHFPPLDLTCQGLDHSFGKGGIGLNIRHNTHRMRQSSQFIESRAALEVYQRKVQVIGVMG